MHSWIKKGVLTVGLLGLLSACSNEGTEEGTAWDKIKESKTLTVATSGTLYPASFHEGDDNELTGYDVELVKELAERLDLDVTFKEVAFDGMLTSVNSGQVDLAANDITLTEERQEKFAFSIPYKHTYGAAIVRKSDLSDIESLADIKGKKAAGEATTTYMEVARHYGAEEVIYDNATNDQYLQDVANGRTDIILNDYYTQKLAEEYFPDLNITVHPTIAYNPSEIGLILNKENKELKTELDRVLTEMKEDGTIAKLSKQFYDGVDVSEKSSVDAQIIDTK